MSRKGITGFKDLRAGAPPADDGSDEDGGAGGGRASNAYVGSGQNVVNPKKPKDVVDAIMKKQGTGGAASAEPVDMKVKLVFWKSGYTIDAGEGAGDLNPYDTAEGKAFMLSIYSERIPAELIAMAKAKGVSPKDMDVEIEDNRQAAGDYVKPPEPAYRAYGGEGSSVGAVAPPPSTAIFSSAGARTATPLDAAAPKTTLQVKLANGKRAIIELNLTHTVADLVARVASEGATGGKAFLLKTGYPPKPLDTLTETIEGAGLKNASVLQIIA